MNTVVSHLVTVVVFLALGWLTAGYVLRRRAKRAALPEIKYEPKPERPDFAWCKRCGELFSPEPGTAGLLCDKCLGKGGS